MTGPAANEPNWTSYALALYLSDSLRAPVIHTAIQALQFPWRSRGLDAGCGIGCHTFTLADVIGPEGHVTGVDISAEFLDHARKFAEVSGFSEQVTFQKGDVNNLPFEDDSFDWAWSVDCVGYTPGKPVPLLKELSRVVKPGGTIAILMWSSQQLLPGYPQLEARLNASTAGIAPFARGKSPDLHFLRALGWFQAAGLIEARALTLVGSVHAPLSDDIRSALLSLFQMRWGEPKSEMTEEDWKKYQRLCRPDSSDFILNLPDYYAFFTYSLFYGTVAT